MTEQEFVAFFGTERPVPRTVAENLVKLDPFPGSTLRPLVEVGATLNRAWRSSLRSHFAAALCPRLYAVTYPVPTLVRGIWLMYAASDAWIEKLSRPLTEETAEGAKDALMLDKMLKGLRSSASAPEAVLDQIEACRGVMWKALNSYSHGGFHPLARIESGYPLSKRKQPRPLMTAKETQPQCRNCH